MTLDEARLQLQGRIEGTIGAMKAAGSNGKPIFMPDGRPAPGIQPPPIGDILALLLQSMHLEFQYLNALGGMLAGGFTLSDQEAGRMADLVLERLKAHETRREELVQEG